VVPVSFEKAVLCALTAAVHAVLLFKPQFGDVASDTDPTRGSTG